MKHVFENEIVIQTRSFTVGQDWEVPIAGFFIIAPLRKIRSVADLSDDEAADFILVLRREEKR